MSIQGQEIFPFFKISTSALGPAQPLFSGFRASFTGGEDEGALWPSVTCNLAPTLRMSGAISLRPSMPSWGGRGQHCFLNLPPYRGFYMVVSIELGLCFLVGQ